MTTPNQAWFTTVMKLVRPWIEPLPRPPFSKKETKLIQFLSNLNKCSNDQKLQLMTLLVVFVPLISEVTVEVFKAYSDVNNSYFLCNWRRKIITVELLSFKRLYKSHALQIRSLFLKIEPLSRSNLIHQMLMTSHCSSIEKIVDIYNHFVLNTFDYEEPKITYPRYSQEIHKHQLIYELSNSSSMYIRRIFFLHQQLEKKIIAHFQQMLQQLYLDIDMELENLLQKILFPLEKKTSTILHPNDVDNDTSSDDYYSDEDDFYDENINEYDGIPSLR